ncbi:MAG: nickel pincer cofactor biosynthesis protein LarB [Pseudomonadales bacterium]
MPDAKDVNLDFDRANRTGLAEAVLCTGKSLEQLQTIAQTIVAADQPMLFTRLDPSQRQHLEQLFPGALEYEPVSRTAFFKPPAMTQSVGLAVVSGGSSDLPVAKEAVRTLNFYGHKVLEVHDVGVAGLWRLTERLDELRSCRIIICVAGMDAALPTVLGGLVPAVLFAVPTSIGYGMAQNGETALRSLLVSCAPGITVTNIDNGYGAACAALRVANNF